jgi:hypothetical protein
MLMGMGPHSASTDISSHMNDTESGIVILASWLDISFISLHL